MSTPLSTLGTQTGTRKHSIARVADTMPEANGPTQWNLFKRISAAYPRRQNIAQAWVEWQKIRPQPTEALVKEMLTTIAWQSRDDAWIRDGGRWVPLLRSWIRDKRWTDEPFEPQSAMPVRQEPERRRPMTKGEAISQQNQAALDAVIAKLRRSQP